MAAKTATRASIADPMYDTEEAAAYLGRKRQTLYNWRSARKGPNWSGENTGVRYRKSDLDAWIKANTHAGTR